MIRPTLTHAASVGVLARTSGASAVDRAISLLLRPYAIRWMRLLAERQHRLELELIDDRDTTFAERRDLRLERACLRDRA